MQAAIWSGSVYFFISLALCINSTTLHKLSRGHKAYRCTKDGRNGTICQRSIQPTESKKKKMNEKIREQNDQETKGWTKGMVYLWVTATHANFWKTFGIMLIFARPGKGGGGRGGRHFRVKWSAYETFNQAFLKWSLSQVFEVAHLQFIDLNAWLTQFSKNANANPNSHPNSKPYSSP